MKESIITFALLLLTVLGALASTPDKKLEEVVDPETGEIHYQCINPGDNCDTGC